MTAEQVARWRRFIQLRPLRVGGRVIRFRPNYKQATVLDLFRKWYVYSDQERDNAVEGLEKRLAHRGSSYHNTLFVMALVGAVEIALAIGALDKGLIGMRSAAMGWSAVACLLGVSSIVVGLIPFLNTLIPRRLEDEGMDALNMARGSGRRGRFGYFLELRSRSHHQRHALWRCRIWFAISVAWTLVSIQIANMSILNYIWHL